MATMKLLEPFQIAGMTLRNRLVFPATTNNLSNLDGDMTEAESAFNVERAKGGTALIIVPGYVEPNGRIFPKVAGIWDDKHIPAWAHMARGIRAYGGRACVQLMHGGRYIHHALGVQPVAPSAVPPRVPRYRQARELSTAEVQDMVKKYGSAARRAREAGMDCLEVLANTGYLISSFISPWSNRRTDQYGGSLENRARFLLEVLAEVHANAPALPLMVRLTAEELMPGGTSREELRQVGVMCQEAGVDSISLTVGWHESSEAAITSEIPAGDWLPLAAYWKKVISVPIMMAYRLHSPQVAEKALQEGFIDLAAMCRPLVAEPEMANKLAEGRPEDIIPCVTCNQGCFDRVFNAAQIRCLVNARTGRESLEEYQIKPAPQVKRVLVIGGGPAGMEAARVAALRGHKIVLCEKSDRLGGQLNLAALAPHRQEMADIVTYLTTQLKKAGVDVRLNTEATSDLPSSLSPDAIVVATGATPRLPDGSKGISSPVTAQQVLAGQAKIGARVVIWGGDEIGAQTAEYLALAGHRITILEESRRLAKDMASFDKHRIKSRLSALGVRFLLGTTLDRVVDGEVTVATPQGIETLEADSVVVSLGVVPSQGLYDSLKLRFSEVYAVGDCAIPRKAMHAINEGFRVGNKI